MIVRWRTIFIFIFKFFTSPFRLFAFSNRFTSYFSSSSQIQVSVPVRTSSHHWSWGRPPPLGFFRSIRFTRTIFKQGGAAISPPCMTITRKSWTSYKNCLTFTDSSILHSDLPVESHGRRKQGHEWYYTFINHFFFLSSLFSLFTRRYVIFREPTCVWTQKNPSESSSRSELRKPRATKPPVSACMRSVQQVFDFRRCLQSTTCTDRNRGSCRWFRYLVFGRNIRNKKIIRAKYVRRIFERTIVESVFSMF